MSTAHRRLSRILAPASSEGTEVAPAGGEGIEVAPADWMPHRRVTRCLVCGFAEVRTDEVADRGIVLLTECPRCEYRSTERLSAARPVRLRTPGAEEASAA